MNILLCRGNGVLQSCVLSSNKENLLKLLKNNVNVNTLNQFNESALYVAAYFCESEILEILLKNGADVNSATIEGNTPLHAAAYHGNTDIMETLIGFGADPSIRNAKYSTANDILLEFIRNKNTVRPGSNETANKKSNGSPPDNNKKGSLLERFRCRTLDKRDTSRRIHRIKAIRTKIGTLLTNPNRFLSYSTAIPVIDQSEMSEETGEYELHNDITSTIMKCSNWRGLSVIVRKTKEDFLTDETSSNDVNFVFQNQVARELEVLARIQHPLIMNPLAVLVGATTDLMGLNPKDIGVVFERPYLGSLHYFTKIRLEEIPVLATLTIFRQLAEALLYLQSSGIVHCNVTPHAVYLFAIDAVKLGNFEYAMEIGYVNKSAFDRARSNTMTHGQASSRASGRSQSRSPINRSQPCKPNQTALEASVSRLVMCASHLPADHLADWLPPELFDDHANSTLTQPGSTDTHGDDRCTCPVSFATDVYSLAKLLQSLLPPTKLTVEHENSAHARDGPITNIKMLLKAALQPRPEERLPLKQFHRLLIHLFWNEYDLICPPKPPINNPVPCPLRLCMHHPSVDPREDRQSRRLTPKINHHRTRLAESNSGRQAQQPVLNRNDSQEAQFIRTDNITYRKRTGNGSRLMELDNTRPEVDQGLWTPGSTDTSMVFPAPPTPVSAHLTETRFQNREMPRPIDPNGPFNSDKLIDMRSDSEPCPSSSSNRTVGRENRMLNDYFNLKMNKSSLPDVSPHPENHADCFTGPCETAAQSSSTTATADKHPCSDKQVVARSKLSRFYPFINEWLKRKRILPGTVDSPAGPTMFDSKTGMTMTPFCRFDAASSKSGTSTPAPKPLSSCLQRSSSRRSKSVKLSHAEYVQLAAVPRVPEGVDVPPDLVPHRILSAPQQRLKHFHRSYTPFSEPNTIPKASSCQRFSSSADRTGCRWIKHMENFSLLSTSFNSEQMPLKPASHWTRTPQAIVNYADVTGKPDLIRSSSRLSRRNKHHACSAHTEYTLPTTHAMNTHWSKYHRRSRSCSALMDRLCLCENTVRVRSISTQTEQADPHGALCSKPLNAAESRNASTELSSATGFIPAVSDSRSFVSPSACDEKNDFGLEKAGIDSNKKSKKGASSVRRSFSTHVTRVGRMVELFESKNAGTVTSKREFSVCRPFWTPRLGLRDTSPHPQCPRSLTRIQAGSKVQSNSVQAAVEQSNPHEDIKMNGLIDWKEDVQERLGASSLKIGAPIVVRGTDSGHTESRIAPMCSPTQAGAKSQNGSSPAAAAATTTTVQTNSYAAHCEQEEPLFRAITNLLPTFATGKCDKKDYSQGFGNLSQTVQPDTTTSRISECNTLKTLLTSAKALKSQESHECGSHKEEKSPSPSVSSLNWPPPPPSLEELLGNEWDKENTPAEYRLSAVDSEYQSFLSIPLPGYTASENLSPIEPTPLHYSTSKTTSSQRTPFAELGVVTIDSPSKQCSSVNRMKHRTAAYATRMHRSNRECLRSDTKFQ